MTTSFQQAYPELIELLDALCEESITAEQSRRLEELVLAHPEAEAYYVQHMAFYADLSRHFGVVPLKDEQDSGAVAVSVTEGSSTVTAKQATPAKAARGRRLGLRWGLIGLAAVAAGIIVAVALWPLPGGIPAPGTSPVAMPAAEAIDHTVAVLVRAPGAVWQEGAQGLRAGAPLSPGWLRLKSGSAQVEFYNGAVVILSGPAEFKLISRTEAYCARGKLRALVPPQAVGFTIGSPKLDVVDRGTEFGLEVGAEGKTEVHVFQGRVELHDPGSDHRALAPKELTTGQSVRLEALDKVRPIKPNPGAFPTSRDLAEHTRSEIQRRRQNWLAASAAWRKDPSLMLYYTFHDEEAWSRTLLDQAGERQQPRDGAIVGCSWGTGRWPGKQGLEFRRVSDRVRVHVPGKFESITLAAWVRVDTLQNRNNSLLMVDGWPPGGLHWQIGDDGTLILGVQSKPKGHAAHYHASEILTPDRLGQWVHLAVVYDKAGKLVTHYVDGRPASQSPVRFDIPLCLDNVEIGNWNVADHRNNTPVRNLNGCMDELMLFSRALGEREMEQLYRQSQLPL
jgi:hypothetical protein